MRDNPDLKGGDISKLIAKMFKQLPEDEKKVYVDLAEKDKIRHKREMEDYMKKSSNKDNKDSKNLHHPTSLEKSSDEKVGDNHVIDGMREEAQEQKDRIVNKGDNSSSVEGKDNPNSDSGGVKDDSNVDVPPMDDKRSYEGEKVCTETKDPVVVSKSDDKITPGTSISNVENALSEKGDDNREVQALEEVENDEEITLGSDEENDEQSCDEDETEHAQEDKEFLALDDGGASCTVEGLGGLVNKNEPIENFEKTVAVGSNVVNTEKKIVNILQPRKKSKEPIIHTLHPRKKLRANDEIKPQKKVKLSELTPRKNFDMTETLTVFKPNQESNKEQQIPGNQATISKPSVKEKDKEVKVNELKPQKKKARVHQSSPQNRPINKSNQASSTLRVGSSASISVSASKLQNSKLPVPLSREEEEHLIKYRTMRSQYVDKMKELVDNAMNGTVEEENFQIDTKNEDCCTDPLEVTEEMSVITIFKDDWVEQLAMLVQGR